MIELKEGDLAMCTVTKIEGITVFVDVEGNGEGTIVMSEIAAGRIRNLREYVVPKKKIVCKILRITNGHPQLSLRRVTAKERKELLERMQKEKTFLAILKTQTQTPEEIINKIGQEYDVADFFDSLKENPSLLGKFMPKKEAEAIGKLIAEKKDKEKEAKKTFSIQSFGESGINDIKSSLASAKSVEIKYLGSSKFSVSSKGKDFKEANNKILQAIESIKAKAKEKKLLFESDE